MHNTHTPQSKGSNPDRPASEPSLLPFDINGGKVPKSTRFRANWHLWEGESLPRRPMKYSIAVLCGDPKATFGTGLVCIAVQQGKQCTVSCGYDQMLVSRGHV